MFISKQVALTLYKTMVLPLFDFEDIIYAQSSQDGLICLEIVQNNACRILLRLDRLFHLADMLSEFNYSSLYARRDFHLNIFMYKIKNGLITSYKLVSMFSCLEENRDRFTRTVTMQGLVHFSRPIFVRKSVRICGLISWNNWHQDLKDAQSSNI